MLMPRKVTPDALVAWYVASRSSASARHGAHQEPQKLTTTTWPRSCADVVAAAGRAAHRRPSGPPERWSGAHSMIPAVLVAAASPALPAEQPASATAAATAASSRRSTSGRASGPLGRPGGRRHGDQVRGRLGVADADDLGAVEVERGEAGQPALPPARVVPEPLALDVPAQRPDRQLVRDAAPPRAPRRRPGRRAARRTSARRSPGTPRPRTGSPGRAAPTSCAGRGTSRRRGRPACPRTSWRSRSAARRPRPAGRTARRSARRSAGRAPAGWPPRARCPARRAPCAAALAICTPSSERRKPGSRP